MKLPKMTILHSVMPDDYRYGHIWGYTKTQLIDFAEAYSAEKTAAIKAERDRLREAASWFMGMSGDFPAREAGAPPYWFRAHFRTRFADICNALQEDRDE